MSDLDGWTRFAGALSRVVGNGTSEHARSLAEQFSRMPRSRVGGVEFHYSDTGLVTSVEAVVGSPEVFAAARRSDPGRTSFLRCLEPHLQVSRVSEQPDPFGDIWVEGSDLEERDGAVLLRRRTDSSDEEWESLIAQLVDDSVRGVVSTAGARVPGMVGVMPARGADGDQAFRLLFVNVDAKDLSSLLRVAEQTSDEMAAYQRVLTRWTDRGGLANLALNVAPSTYAVSGLELYPREIDRLDGWRELTDIVAALTGWESSRVPTLASWCQVWSGARFYECAPSHLVGAAVSAHDPVLYLSPSHAKVSFDEELEPRIKAYMRYECPTERSADSVEP